MLTILSGPFDVCSVGRWLREEPAVWILELVFWLAVNVVITHFQSLAYLIQSQPTRILPLFGNETHKLKQSSSFLSKHSLLRSPFDKIRIISKVLQAVRLTNRRNTVQRKRSDLPTEGAQYSASGQTYQLKEHSTAQVPLVQAFSHKAGCFKIVLKK